MTRQIKALLTWLCILPLVASAFSSIRPTTIRTNINSPISTTTHLKAVDVDLDTVALVVPDLDTAALVVPAVDTVATVATVAAAALEDIDQGTLSFTVPDLDTIAMVVGQENYGLILVLLGEGIWSLSKAPSIDHAIKTLVPAIIAAVVLGAVSGPMVTSGDPSTVTTGLFIATGVSVAMGAVYLARCLTFSPSPKEIPAGGVIVAVAGFFSFSQNLLVDGFVTLPSIPLPSLPTFELPF
jgi:hypothetical protein